MANPKNPPSFLGIAWTRERAWADPETIGKKVEMLREDIKLGRRDFASCEGYLDGLRKYFESILSEEAAAQAVLQIEELLGPEVLRTQKGERNNKSKNHLARTRENQRAHQGQEEGQPHRMITHTSNQASGPTGKTHGERVKTESNTASGWIDHGRESHTGSTSNAPSGWKHGMFITSPSTPSTLTLAEAGGLQLHPGASPPTQSAVGMDQAHPRVRHAIIRVDRTLAVVDVRLDGVLVQSPVAGRHHSPTETELAGLVVGWDLASAHGAVGVTLQVEDFYVRHYLSGQFKVGRPWNGFHFEALLSRLEDPEGPTWSVESRSRPKRRVAA